MKSNSIPQVAREKKPYHKPEIGKVSLVMEEAVLATGCKHIGAPLGPLDLGDCVGDIGGLCLVDVT